MVNKKPFAAFLGAAAGLMASRAVDLALIGGGVATATGAVGFAGYMILAGDHEPHINGMEYLAIFAQPARHAAAGANQPDATQPDATKVDVSPIGAIPRQIKD